MSASDPSSPPNDAHVNATGATGAPATTAAESRANMQSSVLLLSVAVVSTFIGVASARLIPLRGAPPKVAEMSEHAEAPSTHDDPRGEKRDEPQGAEKSALAPAVQAPAPVVAAKTESTAEPAVEAPAEAPHTLAAEHRELRSVSARVDARSAPPCASTWPPYSSPVQAAASSPTVRALSSTACVRGPHAPVQWWVSYFPS